MTTSTFKDRLFHFFFPDIAEHRAQLARDIQSLRYQLDQERMQRRNMDALYPIQIGWTIGDVPTPMLGAYETEIKASSRVITSPHETRPLVLNFHEVVTLRRWNDYTEEEWERLLVRAAVHAVGNVASQSLKGYDLKPAKNYGHGTQPPRTR